MQPRQTKISATISLQSRAVLEEMIASGKAANFGAAIDLAIEEMRRARNRKRKRNEKTEPYSAEPSPDEVAEDRATMRAVHESNPDLLFDD
jgi:ribosome-associated translation inhibitor RaiA